MNLTDFCPFHRHIIAQSSTSVHFAVCLIRKKTPAREKSPFSGQILTRCGGRMVGGTKIEGEENENRHFTRRSVMSFASFSELFEAATGQQPFPYQCQLAESDALPSLLSVPTGLGKTAAVLMAWIWRRR
jgi:hypothetical protein